MGCLCGRWDIETEGGLIDEIPPFQLFRWIEYEECEPFSSRHIELRKVLDTATIANSVRAVGNSFGAKLKMVEIDDLLIKSASEREEERAEKAKKFKRRSREEEIKQFQREMKMLAKCGRPMPGK